MIKEKIAEYLKDAVLEGRSPSTVEAYGYHLAKFASWCETWKIDYGQIGSKESKAFRNYLADHGLSPRTVNATLAAVRSFYDYLIEEEEIQGNPWVPRHLRVTEPKRAPSSLSQAEEKKIMEALARKPHYVQLAFKTMLAAGLRVGEAANLKPEDVLVHQGAAFLRVKQGKGREDRLVPVTSSKVARELLDLAITRKGETRLFRVTSATLKVYAHNIKKETGVDFHADLCRHTLATRLLAQGTPLDVVQEVLGHADISTTRKYAATMPGAIFKIAARIEEEDKIEQGNHDDSQQ